MMGRCDPADFPFDEQNSLLPVNILMQIACAAKTDLLDDGTAALKGAETRYAVVAELVDAQR